MFLEKIAPKNFICCYPLRLGAFWVSGVMIIISIISALAILIQVIGFKKCAGCPGDAWRNAYGFNVTAIVYSVIMVAVHVWLIYGIKYQKSSVLIGWVVVTSLWLALTLCLLVVLICVYSADTSFVAWLLSLIFGLIAIGALAYAILVVFGFWLETKQQPKKHVQDIAIANT